MKGEALIERREAAVARGVATVHPIFAERARGMRLRDVDGREYLDFTGGIGVLNVGHLHPRVVPRSRSSSSTSRTPASRWRCTKATWPWPSG